MTNSNKSVKVRMRPIVFGDNGSPHIDFTPKEQEFFQGWQPMTVASEKDQAESKRVGRAIRAAVKQCWFNARKAVLRLDDYTDARYVEGWSVSECGLASEHGWVVKDGKIIDPTLPQDGMVYFPGLEFRGRSGIKEFLTTPEGKKCRRSPFFFAFGWGGMHSPSFRQSWEAAMAYVRDFLCR